MGATTALRELILSARDRAAGTPPLHSAAAAPPAKTNVPPSPLFHSSVRSPLFHPPLPKSSTIQSYQKNICTKTCKFFSLVCNGSIFGSCTDDLQADEDRNQLNNNLKIDRFPPKSRVSSFFMPVSDSQSQSRLYVQYSC